MPLITDDASANANTHSFESHSLHNSTEEGDIPWVLAGPSPEAISAARAKLDRYYPEGISDEQRYSRVVGTPEQVAGYYQSLVDAGMAAPSA